MPFTGYDPTQHGDIIGGDTVGMDPSYYYAVSPGGRFPGDEWAAMEYWAARDRGTTGGNPDYDLPDWITNNRGWLGRLGRFHQNNVQTGGSGQEPSLSGGYPYHFFSGPGAPYGPQGGPLHGLVDQGRPGTWDGPEYRPPGTSEPVPPPRRRGGGGGGGGSFTFQPYQGMEFTPSFTPWNPQTPGTNRTPPAQGQSSLRGRPTAPAQAPGKPTGGRGGGGGGRGTGRRPSGAPSGPSGGGGGNSPRSPGGPSGGPGGPPDLTNPREFLQWLVGGNPMANARDSRFGGVDTSNLDRGTPGWRSDPMSGVTNTAGMPNPTPFARNPGESFDSYSGRLHDQGFSNDDILAIAGPGAGWGTGGVVRGPDGYQFANQDSSQQVSSLAPYRPTGEGVTNLLGADGRTGAPGADALASLFSGWTPHQLYV